MGELFDEPIIAHPTNLKTLKTLHKKTNPAPKLKLHKILKITPLLAPKKPLNPVPVLQEQLHAQTDLKPKHQPPKIQTKITVHKLQQ